MSAGPRQPRLRSMVAVFCVFYLIAPTAIVLGASFTNTAQIRFPPHGLTLRWYAEILSNERTWHALTNSLYVALISVVISLAAGVPAAMTLPKLSGPRRVIIAVALSLGLSTPPIVSAFGLYGVFSQLQVIHSVVVVGVAVGIVNFPFMLWAVGSALEGENEALSQAAATLGARPFEQFLFVRLPVLMPGIITGALLVFVSSLTDYVISQVLTNVDNVTLPVYIYSSLRTTISPALGAACGIFIVLTAILFAGALKAGNVERFLYRD